MSNDHNNQSVLNDFSQAFLHSSDSVQDSIQDKPQKPYPFESFLHIIHFVFISLISKKQLKENLKLIQMSLNITLITLRRTSNQQNFGGVGE